MSSPGEPTAPPGRPSPDLDDREEPVALRGDGSTAERPDHGEPSAQRTGARASWAEWELRKQQAAQARSLRASKERSSARIAHDEARRASAQAYDDWLRRKSLEPALAALDAMHEPQGDAAAGGSSAEGAVRNALSRWRSRAHDDSKWLQVAEALHAAERDALGAHVLPQGADPLRHVSVCGEAWIRWTKASRRVFSDVLVPEALAARLALRDDEGRPTRRLDSLRFTGADPAAAPAQPDERGRLLNRLYDTLCRQMWKRAEASCVQRALPAGAGLRALQR